MALKDAVAEGVKLEDRDGRVADKRSMAGAIVVDSEPYVVMLRHGRIKTDHKPVDGFKARPSACLTDRELQIANLVADGKVNKQIAYQLKISEWTVSTHLRRIFVKYGVNSRANMVKRLLSGEREP